MDGACKRFILINRKECLRLDLCCVNKIATQDGD